MAADQDARSWTHTQIDLCGFGVTIGVGVGLIQQGHGAQTHFPGFENQVGQFLDGQLVVGGGFQHLLNEVQQV